VVGVGELVVDDFRQNPALVGETAEFIEFGQCQN
jgi:hypothetical protein